jgi:hypothetical protein
VFIQLDATASHRSQAEGQGSSAAHCTFKRLNVQHINVLESAPSWQLQLLLSTLSHTTCCALRIAILDYRVMQCSGALQARAAGNGIAHTNNEALLPAIHPTATAIKHSVRRCSRAALKSHIAFSTLVCILTTCKGFM